MTADFLLYGAYGYVGAELARLAVQRGLRPLLAGRNSQRLAPLAAELGLDFRAFALDDSAALEAALQEVPIAVHYAGPYVHTYKPMISACLRTGTHYVDITGELEVYQALAALDEPAQAAGVMILPGAGFDVVPTDCLAAYLQERLPSATHLTLAFAGRGPANIPPGTAETMLTALARGYTKVFHRRNGRLTTVEDDLAALEVDFGWGPRKVYPFTWGDIFMAYISTGIPNISNYLRIPPIMVRLRRGGIGLFARLMKFGPVRRLAKNVLNPGATPEERARSRTVVWGEVRDDAGGRSAARLSGPEGGVEWTIDATLVCVQRMLDGDVHPGFQTPAKAYGPELVMACQGVTREDVD